MTEPESNDCYPMPASGWTCFHCGENFTTVGSARIHFGADPNAKPGCFLKVQPGPELGLLMALRKAEGHLTRYMEEDSETMRQMHLQQARHADQLRDAEELGFALGLAAVQRGEEHW